MMKLESHVHRLLYILASVAVVLAGALCCVPVTSGDYTATAIVSLVLMGVAIAIAGMGWWNADASWHWGYAAIGCLSVAIIYHWIGRLS